MRDTGDMATETYTKDGRTVTVRASAGAVFIDEGGESVQIGSCTPWITARRTTRLLVKDGFTQTGGAR